MREITINSRKLGTTVTFSHSGVWLYMSKGDHPNSPKRQLCRYGWLKGETLMCGPEDFERVARNWWKRHLERVTSM